MSNNTNKDGDFEKRGRFVMKKATCFFCYAWDSDERYDKLDFLRSSIEKRSNNHIDVVLDKHTYEDNADFDILRERIRSYDLVVVFCTPDFKDIISDPDSIKNKSREVLKEYRIIEEIYLADGNAVFPVILEGRKESSLLDIFSNRNARWFEEFKLSRNERTKKLFIPNGKMNLFNTFVGKIINTTIHNNENKSEEYKNSLEALDNLFGLTDNTIIPRSCLVIPDLYRHIRAQTCMFVAGRKGSGKSTFIYNFQNMDSSYFKDHYKNIVPITAEAFQHEIAYNLLVYKHRKDKTIIDTYSLMCLFWQVYFFLHCLVIIRNEIEKHNIDIDNKRYPIFNKITKKLMRKIGLKTRGRYKDSISDSTVPKSIFMAAVEMIDDRFNSAIDEIDDGELVLTSYSGKFTLESIMKKEFGDDITDFLKALAMCKKKIMISLDGFDTHSEDFRIATERLSPGSEEYRNRREYEVLFFRTLPEVVTKLKYQKTHDNVADALSAHIDFCIILPKDRYDFIIKNDRDSFKKNFGTLSWSAQELMELITKRLEYLIKTINPEQCFDESADYFDRLNSALKYFPGLPSTITMNVNGNRISMTLFNYILRSSFWRPRDVISNLSKIMAQMLRLTNGNWVSNDEGLSENDIKMSMRSNAEKIIEEEFIGEYKYVFRNLNEVLRELQRLDEQMEVEIFKEKLNSIRFDTMFSYDMSLVDNKMRVLYQLGVIGLLYNKKISEHQRYLNHICFEFNEGMAPFEDLLKYKILEKNDVFVIFNPIFARRLMLNYNTKELIGNWDANYVKSNHTNKDTIHGM